MAFGKKNENVLRRSLPSWEIQLDEKQLEVLRKVSDNLWLCNTNALKSGQQVFDSQLAPLYRERRQARKDGDATRVAELSTRIKQRSSKCPTGRPNQCAHRAAANDPLFAKCRAIGRRSGQDAGCWLPQLYAAARQGRPRCATAASAQRVGLPRTAGQERLQAHRQQATSAVL